MILVIGIGGRDAGEQVLIALAGQQIAVVQRFLAEIGQQRITAVINLDREAALMDGLGIVDRLGSGSRQGPESWKRACRAQVVKCQLA